MSPDSQAPPGVLPWSFDTTSVWHTILAGAFALNAVLVLGVLVKVKAGQPLTAIGFPVVEAVVAGFTIVFVRGQEGSHGTLYSDRIEVEPNTVWGVHLRSA